MKKKLMLIVGILIYFLPPNVYGQLLGTQHLKGMDEIYVITVMDPKEIGPSLFVGGLTNKDISAMVVKNLRRNGINAKQASSNYHSPLLRIYISFSNDLELIVADASIYSTIASKRVVIWANSATADYYERRQQNHAISTIIQQVNQQTQWLIGDWQKEN